MNLLYPGFLWALFAVLIPIAIHLFNFRRYKTVLFSDVSLLLDVQKKTNRQRKLRHLLVLISRILGIVFLVLAFAQPYIPSEESSTSHVGIYIDNSSSMLSQGSKGEHLSVAKIMARDLMNTYPSNTRFRLYTNDLEPRHNRWFSKEQVLKEINSIRETLRKAGPERIEDRYKLDFADLEGRIYLISDFQLPQFTNLEKLKVENVGLVKIPTAVPGKNVSIDSAWVFNPVTLAGFNQTLHFRLKNHGRNTVESPVTLEIEGRIIGNQKVSIDPRQIKDLSFDFKPKTGGVFEGSLKIEGPYHYFDDEHHFSLTSKDRNEVSVISDQRVNPTLAKIFDDPFTHQYLMTQRNLDLEKLQSSDLLILDHLGTIDYGLSDQVQKMLSSGKNILLLPSSEADIKTYNPFFETLGIPGFTGGVNGDFKISEINYRDPYFSSSFSKNPENVEIPDLKEYFKTTGTRGRGFDLIRLSNGELFAARYKVDNGNIIVLHAGLEEAFGNWFRNDLILPLLYQALIYKDQNRKVSKTLDKDQNWTVDYSFESEEPVKIWVDNNPVIPLQEESNGKIKIRIDHGLSQSGRYPITLKEDTIDILALNHSRSESEVEYLSFEEFSFPSENWLVVDPDDQEIRDAVNERINSINYWKQCLLLALVFFLAEVLLLRFWKSA